MTTFESKASINKPANEVYQFLADMNNHQQLMPENIQDWTSTLMRQVLTFRIWPNCL